MDCIVITDEENENDDPIDVAERFEQVKRWL